MSKDIITEFRGRGDEVHIYPLTFKEFMQAYEGDMYHGWAEYMVYGGLPLTVKYYFEDVGFRNARLGFRQIEETHIMENIV